MWLGPGVNVPFLGEANSFLYQGWPLTKSNYVEECLWLGGMLCASRQSHELLKNISILMITQCVMSPSKAPSIKEEIEKLC